MGVSVRRCLRGRGLIGCAVRFRNWFHTTSDGNFHATDKNKLIDQTDFPLTLGAAYFADERDYKVFVTHAKPQKEVSYAWLTFGE